MLYGTGLTPADLQKPQVGICSMWWEGNTCNMHLDKLACYVKEGVQAAGLPQVRAARRRIHSRMHSPPDAHTHDRHPAHV